MNYADPQTGKCSCVDSAQLNVRLVSRVTGLTRALGGMGMPNCII
jgi:hypothetical protein